MEMNKGEDRPAPELMEPRVGGGGQLVHRQSYQRETPRYAENWASVTGPSCTSNLEGRACLKSN